MRDHYIMRDIVLPDSKPALEWVNGRILQKVSHKRRHALAQTRFAAALDAWAARTHRGEVGTEWEFRIAPPGEERRPLIPDIAFLAFGRVPYADESAVDIPYIAPDAVVEVLSTSDRRDDTQEKIRVYLAAGVRVVFLVNTDERSVLIHDVFGVRRVSAQELITHESLPGFKLPAKRLFERIRPQG